MSSQMNRGQLDGEQCDKCEMRKKRKGKANSSRYIATCFILIISIHIYMNLWTDIGNDQKKLVSQVNRYDTPCSELNITVVNYLSDMLGA